MFPYSSGGCPLAIERGLQNFAHPLRLSFSHNKGRQLSCSQSSHQSPMLHNISIQATAGNGLSATALFLVAAALDLGRWASGHAMGDNNSQWLSLIVPGCLPPVALRGTSNQLAAANVCQHLLRTPEGLRVSQARFSKLLIVGLRCMFFLVTSLFLSSLRCCRPTGWSTRPQNTGLGFQVCFWLRLVTASVMRLESMSPEMPHGYSALPR